MVQYSQHDFRWLVKYGAIQVLRTSFFLEIGPPPLDWQKSLWGLEVRINMSQFISD